MHSLLTLITHRTVLHGKAVRRAHRAEELKLILSLRHQRKLPKNLTIQFRNTEYQLTSYGKGYRLRGATITICQGFNGSVTLLQKAMLTYRTLRQGEPAVIIADDRPFSTKSIKCFTDNKNPLGNPHQTILGRDH